MSISRQLMESYVYWFKKLNQRSRECYLGQLLRIVISLLGSDSELSPEFNSTTGCHIIKHVFQTLLLLTERRDRLAFPYFPYPGCCIITCSCVGLVVCVSL